MTLPESGLYAAGAVLLVCCSAVLVKQAMTVAAQASASRQANEDEDAIANLGLLRSHLMYDIPLPPTLTRPPIVPR